MSKLTIRVNEDTLTVTPIIKTLCCGAVLYDHLKPEMCPTCGGPIGNPVMDQERTFNSAKYNGTRYWS